jgi:hypothetical protein
VRQATLTGSVVDAVIAWHDPASYAGYAWLIADTSDADVAAKTLSDAVEHTIAAPGAVTIRRLLKQTADRHSRRRWRISRRLLAPRQAAAVQ